MTMQRYLPSTLQAVTNWICSMLFLMISLTFPFLIAVTYHESIPQKTMHIALGMYFLTVATTARNLAVFFFLLLFAIYMFSAYGAFKDTDYFIFSKDMWSFTGFIVFLTTFIAGYEKWYHHVVKREPFLPFDKSQYQ